MGQLIITRSGANIKKYYYLDGTRELGPFTYEELKAAAITQETMVWFDGLDKWTKAGLIDELRGLFRTTPDESDQLPGSTDAENRKASFSQNTMQIDDKARKRKRMLMTVISICGGLIIIAALVILMLIFKGNSHRNNNRSVPVSGIPLGMQKDKIPEGLRQEILKNESKEPGKYLTVHYSLKFGVHSGKDIIKGDIYNFATLTTYKNIALAVNYASRSDISIKTENFMINDSVRPASSISFTIKTYSPEGTKKIGVRIAGVNADGSR